MEHVIDALRGNLFRRHAEKAVAFRQLFVHQDDHSAFPDFFQTFFNRTNWHTLKNRPATLSMAGLCLTLLRYETLNIFTDEIGFNIDFITKPASAQISMLQSQRDNHDRKSSPAAFVDRQADAVHRDGTFRYQQRAKRLRHPETEKRELAFF